MKAIANSNAARCGALPLVALAARRPARPPGSSIPASRPGYLYDDNYRLTPPGREIDVQGPVVDAALELRTLTQTGEFSFTPRVRATYFPDATDLDAVDYFGTLDWQHRGQRVQTRIRGELSPTGHRQQRATRCGSAAATSASRTFGDAGVAFVDNRRTRASLRPSMSFELSPRRELQFGAGYTDVNFERQSSSDAQVDYTTADCVRRACDARSTRRPR